MRGEYTLDNIKIHSAIDIITNSSTESFVHHTDMATNIVFGIIQQVIGLYNTTNGTVFTMEDLKDDVVIEPGKITISGDLCGSVNKAVPYELLMAIYDIFDGEWDDGWRSNRSY